MAEKQKTLFTPIVSLEKLHPHFEVLRSSATCEPTRWMLDDIYLNFDDPEGNFLEQFQTTGFNARYFELYLFAYFSRSGFTVERSVPNPDFIVSRGGTRVAIEATTVNPSSSGPLAEPRKKVVELTEEELGEYEKNELPIKFGSPLFSKLQRRYWELDHCRDLPFVLAIEAFHEQKALAFSDAALTQYLFGLHHAATWTEEGRLQIHASAVKEHTVANKTIPSGFFGQPDAEHVSAVLFTNSGTNAKFSRMGFQHGIGCDSIMMWRTGFCGNRDPDAMDPTFFSYSLDEPPLVESWAQGLVVLHNPYARHPLHRDFFIDAVQGYIENEVLSFVYPDWHPFSSNTLILPMGEAKKKFRALQPKRFAIAAITKEQFQAACGFAVPDSNHLVEEHGWFMDETGALLGVVIRDKIDGDWGYVVLGRDTQFCSRPVAMEASLHSRYKARAELQARMSRFLSHPQRIFPPGQPPCAEIKSRTGAPGDDEVPGDRPRANPAQRAGGS